VVDVGVLAHVGLGVAHAGNVPVCAVRFTVSAGCGTYAVRRLTDLDQRAKWCLICDNRDVNATSPSDPDASSDLRDRIGEALDPVTVAASPAEVVAGRVSGVDQGALVPSPAAFDALVDAVLPVVEAWVAERERRVREQTLRKAADLLDSKPLHCDEHGSVTCTDCLVGSDWLRVEADRVARGES
jgi:hypothetical protein